MPTIRLYQIDAFTRHVFSGNPAAVCPLEVWPDDTVLQAIASENNLSETAFFANEGAPDPAAAGERFRLRWFSPVKEVSLCGHATLASAFVIFTEMQPPRESLCFETLSGPLFVQREQEGCLALDFPAKRLEPYEPPEALLRALGLKPQAVLAATPGRSLVAVYSDEDEVRGIEPDYARLAALGRNVAVTAPGKDCDCVSRYFAPVIGVPEDPVTGSIHCALTPYWAQRLGKRQLYARQVSRRGGELFCEDRGERVKIAGYAVKYMEGTITV